MFLKSLWVSLKFSWAIGVNEGFWPISFKILVVSVFCIIDGGFCSFDLLRDFKIDVVEVLNFLLLIRFGVWFLFKITFFISFDIFWLFEFELLIKGSEWSVCLRTWLLLFLRILIICDVSISFLWSLLFLIDSTNFWCPMTELTTSI